jgi:hypothetical protein
MKDDHEEDHKELAINLQTAMEKTRVHRTYLSAAIPCQWSRSEVWRRYYDDEKIHQKCHARALFLPHT